MWARVSHRTAPDVDPPRTVTTEEERMIVTFRTKATGELIMLGQHALPLMEAAGKSRETLQQDRGVFTPEQLPAAIEGIERAISQTREPQFDEDDPAQAEKAKEHVALRQRAYPLLDLLRKSEAKGVEVMWEINGR